MHIHILGVCGTFMGGVAMLACELGHRVTGHDANVYPPMSLALESSGIAITAGYENAELLPRPDLVLVGNAISRGNPTLEAVIDQGIPYTSGPAWLAEQVLGDKRVVAVSGTHGKTTTTALITWILQQAGLKPGFLIGGVAQGFTRSAVLGQGDWFVIEADEYDSAFFDKRSKFIHYRPEVLVMNNLEFDHADIFADLEAIKKQFAILLRTVPSRGLVIHNAEDASCLEVIERGCWSRREAFNQQQAWYATLSAPDGSAFKLSFAEHCLGEVQWSMLGFHNVSNAIAAAAAAHAAGVSDRQIIQGLNTFAGVKRRLEVRAAINGITVYDDFAHHPTAIATTLQGLRLRVKQQRIFAVLQFASNTMKLGIHDASVMSQALSAADQVFILQTDDGGMALPGCQMMPTVDSIILALLSECQSGDHILIMSNKGFENIHARLIEQLQSATVGTAKY